MSNLEIILVVLLIIFICIAIIYYPKSNSAKKSENVIVNTANVDRSEMTAKWEEEKMKLLSEKSKFEEKNKKLWAMSEAVHKERKKVDEDNEKLIEEKEKLIADKKKLDDKVKKLWQTSTAIHKEKERINELKLEIEHKHQEIIDSVNYAKRIQRALLASNTILKQNLNEYFVLFQPRDIVSGDFYWASKLANNQFLLAVADSTGHGVPGAIMSILNISCLNEAVNAEKLNYPNLILDYSRKRIMEHMSNDGSEEGGKDGMDCVLCNFDFAALKLSFAAANNPLWIIRNNEIIEFKPDKMPVGKAMGEIRPFTLHEFPIETGDLIIMITDGFADQFGGPKGKKFMYKPLKELILSVHNAPLIDIKNHLIKNLDEWKGNLEQVDDILIIGIRV